MRIPRVRFTVRMMLAAVALIGSGCWGIRMVMATTFYLNEVHHHEFGEQLYRGEVSTRCSPDGTESDKLRKAERHARLKHKYERAARAPWLSVEPDLPDPE